MTVADRLKEICDSKMVNRVIVLLDSRSDFVEWCFLYDLRRGYYQFNEDYTKMKLTEEKHYTKDGDQCISLQV